MAWIQAISAGWPRTSSASIELDCALIHASSADVGDALTADSSPLLLLDRLTRLDVNRLFTARGSGSSRLELTGGTVNPS